MKLDATLDYLQSTQFDNKYNKFIKKATKSTELTEHEVTFILMAFYKFAITNNNNAKYITKNAFLTALETLFGLHNEAINERIVCAIDPSSKGLITPTAWIRLFDIYLSEPLSEKQLQFCYKVYDLNNSGSLERAEDVAILLNHFVIVDDDDVKEEILIDLMDLVMQKMDIDKDGQVSYADYIEAVHRRPAMMQFLGACIPDIGVVKELFPIRNRLPKKRRSHTKRHSAN